MSWLAPARSAAVVALVAATSLLGCAGAAASEQGEIPAWSEELDKQLKPWCPGECEVGAPFVASYEKGDRVLVFVAARHEFDPESPTFRAVDAGFEAAKPGVVIVEGFPTQMGENPAPLVEQAGQVGTGAGNDFTRSEATYAISKALTRNIPFFGGEPTRAEQVAALGRKGFDPTDIAFSYLLGGLAQSVRSKTLTGTSDPKLAAEFARYEGAFKDQYQLKPLSWEEFKARYRATLGVELTQDRDITTRSDPGTGSIVARLNRADMITRDEHLLGTIESQLATRKRVLVIYGSSHWTTLAQALEKRLGKPAIKSFIR